METIHVSGLFLGMNWEKKKSELSGQPVDCSVKGYCCADLRESHWSDFNHFNDVGNVSIMAFDTDVSNKHS